MKKIFTLFLLSFFSFTAFSQKTIPIPTEHLKNLKNEHPQSILDLPKTSNYTRLMFLELKRIGWTEQQSDFIIPDSIAKKYFLIKSGSDYSVNSFIVLNDTTDFDFLNEYEIKTGSRSRNILTGFIPLKQFDDLGTNPKIKYIEIGTPVHEKLDNARSSTYVNNVHQGLSLPQGYEGSGVVVGVIDNGIDYTHPTFFNDGYTATRIKRVWEQNPISATPHPSGYSYGRELLTQSSILNAQRDNPGASHGSHTTGIAAGSGLGNTGLYRGIAPLADIALVSYSDFTVQNCMMNAASIQDGISYLFNYSGSVNKPCVVNMSLGTHIGPHDGTSVFDQFCDGITGPGKLLVGAAGNEGDFNIHYIKDNTWPDTLGLTFGYFKNSSLGTNGIGTFDFWSTAGYPFYVAVDIYNQNTNTIESWTPYIPVNGNGSYSYTLYDQDLFVPDQCLIDICTEINPSNGKPHTMVSIDNTDQTDAYQYVMFELISWGGQIDGWSNHEYYVDFRNLGFSYPFIAGNTNRTIGEIGGTGNSIISVGAYNSKNSWTALNGGTYQPSPQIILQDSADFSSRGPTADLRVKPDITAPGNRVVSSVNRFDTGNYPSNSNSVVDYASDGTNNWFYAQMSGTSMASPVVAGILALWLEAYPYLTPQQAKTLLKNSAIHDSYTGAIPNGSYTWGWGKANAWLGMQQLLSNIPAKPIITGNSSMCQGQSITLSAPSGYSAYQWSTGATTQNISVSSAGNYTVRVTNSLGYISPWSDPKVITVNPNVTPTINITANPSGAICSGASVTYTASITNGGTSPSYQWKKSGSNVGSNSATFSTSTLANGNVITCVLTSNANCPTSPTATSNGITVAVNSPVTPSINITANPSGAICSGTSVTFNSSPTNGGTSPSYQWKVNGGNVGSNSSVFSSSTLTNGNIVSCVLTSNAICPSSTTANSNNITMSVSSSITPSVSVSINPSGTVCPSTSITFTATPSGGGSSPSYQWKVNGGNVGSNSSSYNSSTLVNGDIVTVVLTTSASCASQPTATSNPFMVAIWGPAIANAGNDDTITVGNSTTLTATGGGTYLWNTGSTSQNITVSPTQTTIYTVTITDAHTCTASDNVTVFVQPACSNVYTLSSSTVNVPASGGNCSTALTTDAACSWNVNAGGCIGWVNANNPSGSGSINISFTVQPNTVPSQRTCFATIEGNLFSIIQAAAITDIQELSEIKNISLFPNPNNGVFTLNIESPLTQKVNANVFNSLGQLILKKEIETNSQTEFDLSENAKGIYYLRLFAGERYYYEKLLIE